jgi:hypothetical protein
MCRPVDVADEFRETSAALLEYGIAEHPFIDEMLVTIEHLTMHDFDEHLVNCRPRSHQRRAQRPS